MLPRDLNNPNIPIVGQGAQIIQWFPTTIVVCECNKPEQNFIVLVDFNNPAPCPRCGTLYSAVFVEANEQHRGGLIRVAAQAPLGRPA